MGAGGLQTRPLGWRGESCKVQSGPLKMSSGGRAAAATAATLRLIYGSRRHSEAPTRRPGACAARCRHRWRWLGPRSGCRSRPPEPAPEVSPLWAGSGAAPRRWLELRARRRSAGHLLSSAGAGPSASCVAIAAGAVCVLMFHFRFQLAAATRAVRRRRRRRAAPEPHRPRA